jgi:hypothetical protein
MEKYSPENPAIRIGAMAMAIKARMSLVVILRCLKNCIDKT